MKMFVVLGVNNLLNVIGPVGIARTEEGRDKVLRDTAYCCDKQEVFEIEIEEDKA